MVKQLRIKLNPAVNEAGDIEVDVEIAAPTESGKGEKAQMTFCFSQEEILGRLNRMAGKDSDAAQKSLNRLDNYCDKQWLKIQQAISEKSGLDPDLSAEKDGAWENLENFLFHDCKSRLGLRFIAKMKTIVTLARSNVFKSDGMQNLFA